MKNATRIAELAILRQQSATHDAGFEAIQLQRYREIYGALYQRMHDVLRIDDEGLEVSITIRSHSGALTLTAAEADKCFDLAPLYASLGSRLNAQHDAIIDILLGIEKGTPLDAAQLTDEPTIATGLALCLPEGFKLNSSQHQVLTGAVGPQNTQGEQGIETQNG